MSRWRSAAWAGLGAGAMALGLYGAGAIKHSGMRETASAEDADARSDKDSPSQKHDLVTDPGTLARLGVRTGAVTTAVASQMADGFARGLDAGPLAAIVAETDAARAAAGASQAEAARLEALYRQDVSASRRSVESARAQALADASRSRLAEQRIGLEFGSGLFRLGPAAIRQLVGEIANGRAALIRIDIAGAMPAQGSVIEIGEPGSAMAVQVLGPAATADARLQSAGVLAIVRGLRARQAQAGRILPARAATGVASSGMLVPRDAIVRFQGRMWVFRLNGKVFERVVLDDPQSSPQGWIVRGGLKAGDVIAVAGAAGLLAIDAGGAVSDAEE